MKSASEMSKAIRMKKKMVNPENVLEEHMKDPIDELVKENDSQVEAMDKNNPKDSFSDNADPIKYPENDALDMDIKKKKMRISKIMNGM